MNLPDLINGLFEFGGAATLLLNIKQLLRDRKISGVHWAPTVFFTVWGMWNLIYYPSLHQWTSLAGGVLVCLANLTWLTLVIYFHDRGD